MKMKNRVVLAPLTQNRATMDLVPTDRDADVSMLCHAAFFFVLPRAGLIVSEATAVSKEVQGYPPTPGIFTADQIAGWKKITDAVHARGSKQVCQIWHCGRVGHESYHPEGKAPLAPSALACPEGEAFTMEGFKPFTVPREMTVEYIETAVEQFRQEALNSIEAGFDGVEIHATNGYLIDQFLKDSSNKRTDNYSGSLKNRFRFLREIVVACQQAIGKDKLNIRPRDHRSTLRLSPGGTFNATKDDKKEATGNHEYFMKELSALDMSYLHVKLADHQDERHGGKIISIDTIRKCFGGALVTNNRYDE
ncbi:unnamed protein product [Laminaria digitata]